MHGLEQGLLNDFQRDFPLSPRPFSAMAQQLGTVEAVVIQRLRRLQEQGAVSRVGPVFRPHTLGASTLAALAVPPSRLTEVADQVSAYPAVNHNYEREHRLNLWFVLNASTSQALQAILSEIQQQTGLTIWSFPMLKQYRIDLGFRLPAVAHECRTKPGHGPSSDARRDASHPRVAVAVGRHRPNPLLIAAIQEGLPLVPRPYAAAGHAVGLSEEEVIEGIAQLLSTQVIRRFGVVVRHRELGYRANAMVVWDVSDDKVDRLGQDFARHDFVTLCYRRARALPGWPYNLYCMIHGCERATVMRQVQELRQRCQAPDIPYTVLFSRRRFKQRGALYVPAQNKGQTAAA
ncbi:MAG: Lrp/AsnC family transcriptional regulator [Gammaproteobacteria bacterium]